MLRDWAKLLGLSLTVLSVGCASAPSARSVVAPDGAPAFHVSCGADQAACFALAGEACPHGYRLKPIFDSGNFLVRCSDPTPALEATPMQASGVVVYRVQERLPDSANARPFIPSLGPYMPPPGQRWYPGAPWRPPFAYRAPREIDRASPYVAETKPELDY